MQEVEPPEAVEVVGPNGAEDPTLQPEEDFCPKPTISRADLELMRMNTGSQIPSEASTVQCFFSGKVLDR